MIVIKCETYDNGAYFVKCSRIMGLEESVIYGLYIRPHTVHTPRDAILVAMGYVSGDQWVDQPEAVQPCF